MRYRDFNLSKPRYSKRRSIQVCLDSDFVLFRVNEIRPSPLKRIQEIRKRVGAADA